MIQRRALLAAASLAALGPAFAQGLGVPAPVAAAPPRVAVDTVKIMSFACSFCLASETHDRIISDAVLRTGGRFVRAPIPVGDNASGWRERAYYAARDMDAEFGEVVKQSLYRGLQESEVALDNVTQLYHWFLQDIPKHEHRFNKLFEQTQAAKSEAAMIRAIQLTKNVGASQLPTYVLLVGGTVRATLDTTNSKGTSLAALRDDVIDRLEKLTNPKL